MRIISMAWTSSAFRAGRKFCTRRSWATRYAMSFTPGEHVQVWEKSQRIPSAKRIGVISLEARPLLEDIADAPDEDYEREGFAFYHEHPELLPRSAPWPDCSWDTWLTWKQTGGELWVIRFQIVTIDEILIPPSRQERLAL